ncbi:MAG: nitrous oxide reductase family maturation protein NosD [Thermoplasmata archaeon]
MDRKSLLTSCIILLLVVSTVAFGLVESSSEKINETVESEDDLSIDQSSEKERLHEDEIEFKTGERWPSEQEEKGQLDGKEDLLEINHREKIKNQIDEDNYTTREPINIHGNDEFHEKAEENNWSGDGTEQDPYIIEGYEIDGSEPTYAIIIGHTDVHFVVRNNYLYGAWFPEPYWYTGAITLMNVTNGIVNDNTIRGSSCGVNLGGSYNKILNNTLIDNVVGIRMRTSQNNTVDSNNITNEEEGIMINAIGIHLWGSDDNIVTENRISNYKRNGSEGIFADSDSKNNYIYHNIMINNEVHAVDQGDNIWSKPYPIGGNYWDNHTEPDEYSGPDQNESGSDGFVDEPKEIKGEGDNVDKYPLTTTIPPEVEEADENDIPGFNLTLLLLGMVFAVAIYCKKSKKKVNDYNRESESLSG